MSMPLPLHPEPWAFKWSELEAKTITAYGQACREQALEKSEKDKARLDWLEQNLFNRENLDMFGKVCKTHFMWAMFAPRGVQGSARTIIDAAMKEEKK